MSFTRESAGIGVRVSPAAVNREGKMRIVTWNMGFNDYAYRPRHDEAWRFLVDELQPARIRRSQCHPSAGAT